MRGAGGLHLSLSRSRILQLTLRAILCRDRRTVLRDRQSPVYKPWTCPLAREVGEIYELPAMGAGLGYTLTGFERLLDEDNSACC